MYDQGMAPLWYHSGAMEHDARVVAVNVRLPVEVHAALVRLAEAHERSLQREIVAALRQYTLERLVEHMDRPHTEPQLSRLMELAARVQARVAPLQAEAQRLAEQVQPELQRLAERASAEVEAVMGDPSVQSALARIREQLARQQEELRRLRGLVEAEDGGQPGDSRATRDDRESGGVP
jgi:precorrin-2 methylase